MNHSPCLFKDCHHQTTSRPNEITKPAHKKNRFTKPDCVLPEEIMFCILTRLPMKPIGRFKSVCKPWLELLSTPEFVKSHQSQFSSNPKNESFLLLRYNFNQKNAKLCLFDLESTEKTRPTTILDRPLGGAVYIDVVGCCNGLVCIVQIRRRREEIVLWNPALKMSKTLSSPSMDCVFGEMVSLGFGYDEEADDFKVVRIVRRKCKDRGEEIIKGVEVYSVNSESWATIEPGFQFRVLLSRSNAIVNGKPYWVAREVDRNGGAENRFGEVLVCFDVQKLVFQIVPLSNFDYNSRAYFIGLDGSLAAGWYDFDYSVGLWLLDVWVFDEGERIWRKKHSFEPSRSLKPYPFQHISKNGNLLLSSNDSKLYLMNPETRCVKKLFYGAPKHDSFQVFGYTESLRSIKGMVTTAGDKN